MISSCRLADYLRYCLSHLN